jgi:hypothetical protein
MKKLNVIFFAIFSVGLFGQIKYMEEWGFSGVEINYGRPIGSEAFPYHPSREEFHKAVEKGAEAAFTIKVMDEQGNPIEDAEAIVFMEKTSHRREYDEISKMTNVEGIAQISGKCNGHACIVVRKNGWYNSGNVDMYFFFMKNISLKDGKWQPHGKTHEIVLRNIRKKIPMYNTSVSLYDELPEPGTPLGLDLIAGGWVAPNRKGKTADLFLTYGIQENKVGKRECLIFTFPNKGDGIYRLKRKNWSSYKTDYEASKDSYKYLDTMEFHREVKYVYKKSYWAGKSYDERLVSENNIGYEDYLVLRTRTKLDENGNVTYCHYSKIINPIRFTGGRLSIAGFTNPTPNDTNLEEGNRIFP